MGLPQKIKALRDHGGVAGIRVTRNPAAIGEEADVPLFHIVGGRVYVTAIWGVVQALLPTAATTIGLQVNPTVGAAVALDTGALNITDDIVGTIYTLPDDSVGQPMAAILADVGVANYENVMRGFCADVGDIELVVAGATMATGSVRWVLFYVEIDPDAYVIAA